MRKIFILLIGCVVLMSCGKGSNERLLTSATGTIYECLVVMPNRPLSGEALEAIANTSLGEETGSAYQEPISTTYDLVKHTLGADMYGLPQMEPYMVLTQVSQRQFDDYLKPTRNILIIDINKDKYTQVKVHRGRNQWSQPQAIYRIQAPDDESWVAFWLEHGEQVREWFIREELSRQAYFYRASTNKTARAAMQKKGIDMLIPEDYMLIKDTVINGDAALNGGMCNGGDIEVVWCCNNKGSMRRDVVVYSYPYTSQKQFSNAAICSMRDEVLGRIVSAQVEGSRMGTEYKYFPPISRQVQALQSDTIQNDTLPPPFYAIETRGLWKIIDGEAMGGPFVSLTRLDMVRGRVVTAEAFIYASGQKKRNALRQAEAILYTLD